MELIARCKELLILETREGEHEYQGPEGELMLSRPKSIVQCFACWNTNAGLSKHALVIQTVSKQRLCLFSTKGAKKFFKMPLFACMWEWRVKNKLSARCGHRLGD